MLDVIVDEMKMSSLCVSPTERPDIPTPEEDIDFIQIDGRDGDLTVKKGYKDINFSIKFNILEEFNVKSLVRQIKARLLDSKILQMSDDDVYYKIKKVIVGDIENEIDCYGLFVVTFTADPFQYQLGVENITLTKPGDIFNPGTYFSMPRYRVYGNGSGEFAINGEIVKLRDISEYIDIDVELENAHLGNVNLNNYMIGNFPKLQQGSNTISFSGGIIKIEIEPRWRYR